MYNIKPRLLYTIALIFVLPISVFGQNLTETFQKLVWHEAPAFASADWENLLPGQDVTEIEYQADHQLEVFETNTDGFPSLVTLFALENGKRIAKMKSIVEYAPSGHLASLVIFDWVDHAWVRNTRFKRNVDSLGNDLSFTMETWENSNWTTTYTWEKSPSFTLSASISAAGHP